MTSGSHTSQTQPTSRKGATTRILRFVLLAAILLDLALIGLRALRYPLLFAMHGSLVYVLEPVVLLLVYAAVVVGLTAATARSPGWLTALRTGTLLGLIGGAIEVANITSESALDLPQRVVSITTLSFMLSLFLLWAVAGFLGARRTGSFGLGVLAAVCAAMVTILAAVTFGFLLVNIALPQLAHDEIHDPDFLRSQWSDVVAFAIANTFDAGFAHLLEGPIIAAILGALGSAVGRISQTRRARWRRGSAGARAR
jgi:hypothetical protein